MRLFVNLNDAMGLTTGPSRKKLANLCFPARLKAPSLCEEKFLVPLKKIAVSARILG
jgi:hypothetical protein